MSTFRPYRPLGGTQLERLRQHSDRVIGEWHSHWFKGIVASTDCVLPASEDPSAISAATHAFATARGLVYLELSDARCWELLCDWTRNPERQAIPSASGSACRRVVHRLLGDLFDRMAASVPAHPATERWVAATVPADLLKSASGAAVVRVKLGHSDLTWLASPGFIDATVPRSSPRPVDVSPLVRRMESVLDQPISVKLVAQSASTLTVSNVTALAVGDVLMLDRTLHDVWELRSAGGVRLARGNLGRQGTRLAIKLVRGDEFASGQHKS